MESFYLFLAIAALVGVFVGLILLLLKQHRKRGFISLIVSCVIFAIAADSMERGAQQAGFIDMSDQSAAREAGYTSAEEWQKVRVRVLAEQAARDAAQEKAKQAKHSAGVEQQETTAVQAKKSEAKEDARQQMLKKHVRALAHSVYDRFEAQYGHKPIVYRLNDQICQENNYCSFEILEVHVRFMGIGVVTADFNPQIPPAQYREVCAFLFSAISDADPKVGSELVTQTFSAAASKGRVKAEIQGIDVEIKPNSSNYFECESLKRPW